MEWIAIMREGSRLIKSIENEIIMVRFEDFISNPETEIGKLLDFCELPEDRKQLEYANRILSPRPAYGECPLHPAVEGIFLETMQEFAYQ